MLRGVSFCSKRIRRSVLGLRSTRARVVIISETNRPPARPGASAPFSCARRGRRKAVLVIPAIGARTTGGSATTPVPSCSARAPLINGGDLAARQARGEVGLDLIEGDALLGHRVAVTHRHGVVGKGVEVDRDAERRADLVLTSVPAPDRLGVVEVDIP